ncbi:hypothetical protein GCM10010520_51090 [Rhizobium viscosum]|uniref:Glycosyltransferase involved in cell wall biosynthesis n=1 Tax=Rhizobium viscosum TaxID=1673 RepID=A0ABR9IZQ4_RHIVS|nr:glycosyltransferase [Rhizobium viscosum]MBE1508570.1 glycosyltransferase involved in cell wall biosynthesis [Rhizobium viscosum]
MRLSVCIYTYNHESFIEQAVRSALEQDVSFDYEIVIGDDCSTDATPQILHRLAEIYPGRLRIERRDVNLGAEENFARTIGACRGELVAFLDGDDLWTDRNKLASQVDFLDQHPDASFCFHRTRSLNAAQEYVLPPRDPSKLSSIELLLQQSNPVALHTVVARREHLSDLSTWVAGLKLGDWPLCIMLATKGPVGFIPIEMSRHRVHNGGSWTPLLPSLREAYVIQMLNRLSKLLTGEEKTAVDQRRIDLANYWANDLTGEASGSIDDLMSKIARLQDSELSTFLLSHVIERARLINEAKIWHETQSQAWEAEAKKSIFQKVFWR